jgi:peptide/nickel transport system permease protein
MRQLRELRRYPSAMVGLIILGIYVFVAIYAVIAIPHSEAIELWLARPGTWQDTPRRVPPAWTDWFTSDRLPRTIITTLETGATMSEEPMADGMKRVEIVIPFDYAYDGFPSEINLFTEATLQTPDVPVDIYWQKPDGAVLTLRENYSVKSSHRYSISLDNALRSALGGVSPRMGLLAQELGTSADEMHPLHGSYRLLMQGVISQEDEFHEAKLVVYGQVHGWAGTDHLRRDLTIALLWGAPIGLLFGVLAAVGAQVSTFVLAGIGTWFGGKLDGAFHRLTEIQMILPNIAVLIMIGHFYTRSIWAILGLVIVMNIFSASMKTYRAMFLQVKELPYIEAARAYGAGNFRIIFRYLLPRMAPTLLPQFVLIVPLFVFLEASLAVLGLGDPWLPTWGKVIFDARANDALFFGQYYWVVLPGVCLLLIGLGFALVGFSLDRVFNPRLRTL